MKRKILLIMLTLTMMLMFGCKEKEDNSFVDNLSDKDPTVIAGEYADLVNNKPVGGGQSVFSGLSSEEASENTSEISADNVSSDSVDVSENEVIFDDSMIVKDVPAERIDNTSGDNSMQDISLQLFNLSGHNLDKIYVTIGELSLNNTDILGFEDLPDGRGYTYNVGEFNSTVFKDKVGIKVTAVDKKGENIDFGEVNILNFNNIIIDLSQNNEGFYLEEE